MSRVLCKDKDVLSAKLMVCLLSASHLAVRLPLQSPSSDPTERINAHPASGETEVQNLELLLIPQFCHHGLGTGLLVHSNIFQMKPSKDPPRSKLSCSGVISVHKLIPSSHHSLGRLYQALSDDEIGPAGMPEQRLAACRPVSPDIHRFLHYNLRSSRICSSACL